MYPEQQPQPQPQSPEPQPQQPPQQPPYQPPVAEQPPLVVPQPSVITPTPPAPKKSLKLPIILMVWPAATIIAMMILFAIVNALIPEPASDSELFGDPNPIKTVVNVISFGIGALSALLGPISFIVGLVLLIQRKSKQ